LQNNILTIEQKIEEVEMDLEQRMSN